MIYLSLMLILIRPIFAVVMTVRLALFAVRFSPHITVLAVLSAMVLEWQ